MLIPIILLILTLIISLSQINGLRSKPIKPWPWTLVGILVLITILSWVQECNKLNDELYSKDYGSLKPPSPIKKGIKLNRGLFSVDFPNGIIDFNDMGPFLSNIDFKAWIEDERLYVSSIVRDSSSRIIAEIIRNDWKVNPNLAFDKNFDDKAFEVRDNIGSIVFQVILKDNEVFIEGMFYGRNGMGIIMQTQPISDGKILSDQVVIGKGTPPELIRQHNHIRPIFRYPSRTHPGKRL